jgi:hypothetical protein
MLNRKNIRMKGRCWKLDNKMYRPCKILTAHDNRYCKLELPDCWKIHPMFNIALLEQYLGKNPEREVIEIEADDADWEMEKVIASGPSNEDAEKPVFLVIWKGYSQAENTWEKFYNVDENARGLLEDYYVENANMLKDKRFGKQKPRQ